jgi:hypothetical protein
VCRFHIAASWRRTNKHRKRRSCWSVTKLASITFWRLAFSYWFDKPWFLTEEKLVAVLIIPSSWGSQLGGHLHQHRTAITPCQSQLASTFRKWFLSPIVRLNFGFILRENLLMCSLYLPHGVSQRVLWDITPLMIWGTSSVRLHHHSDSATVQLHRRNDFATIPTSFWCSDTRHTKLRLQGKIWVSTRFYDSTRHSGATDEGTTPRVLIIGVPAIA